MYLNTTNLPSKLRGEGQTFFRAFINSELGPPETPPKVRAIHGATSGGPNSELIKALKKVCPPPLKFKKLKSDCFTFVKRRKTKES